MKSYFLEKVSFGDLVEFGFVDNFDGDLFASENMFGELHDGKVTASERRFKIVETRDFSIVAGSGPRRGTLHPNHTETV